MYFAISLRMGLFDRILLRNNHLNYQQTAEAFHFLQYILCWHVGMATQIQFDRSVTFSRSCK